MCGFPLIHKQTGNLNEHTSHSSFQSHRSCINRSCSCVYLVPTFKYTRVRHSSWICFGSYKRRAYRHPTPPFFKFCDVRFQNRLYFYKNAEDSNFVHICLTHVFSFGSVGLLLSCDRSIKRCETDFVVVAAVRRAGKFFNSLWWL